VNTILLFPRSQRFIWHVYVPCFSQVPCDLIGRLS